MSDPKHNTCGSHWNRIFEPASSPSGFWPLALEAVCEVLPASNAALYLQDTSNAGSPRWRLIGLCPPKQALGLNEAEAASLCQNALSEGQAQLRENFGAIALAAS